MKIIAIGDFHCNFPEKLKRIINKEKPDLILSTGDYAGGEEWRPLFKKVFKARAEGIKLSIEELVGEKEYRRLLEKDYVQGKVPLVNLNKLKIPVFSVFGNSDWSKEEFKNSKKGYELVISRLRNIINIQKKKTKFENLKIIGFGGYLDPDFYFTREGMKLIAADNESTKRRRVRYLKEEKMFINLIKCKPDIILSHYTPYKLLDQLKDLDSPFNKKSLGVSFYNRGIEKFSPTLFICGHMHENQGIAKLGKTIILNPGSASDGKMAIIKFDEKNKKFLGVKFIK